MRSRLRVCLWLLAVMGLHLIPVQAQTPEATPAAAPVNPVAPSETIPLKNAQGETVELPRTPLLEEVLRELSRRSLRPVDEPLLASVTSVEIEGSSDGSRANLKCKLQIEVLPGQNWVKLPLQFQEAQLRGFQASSSPANGTGRAVPDLFEPQTGYTWWFQGTGTHTLELDLQCPIRSELPQRRLVLTVPQAAVCRLKLKVPQANPTASKGDERSRLTVTPAEGGGSWLELVGAGPRIDLTWQPQTDPNSAQPSLEVRTSITATVDGEVMLLEANQRLLAMQGSIREVQVRLPRGGELVRLEGAQYLDHQIDPQDKTRLTVRLREAISGTQSADLKWVVKVDRPADGEPFVVEGFEIPGARLQTGHVGLKLVGDGRLAPSEQPNQFVQRDNVSLLAKVLPPLPTADDVKSAYKILRQPFRLAFQLQREQPLVTAKPRLLLYATEDRIELTGEFSIQVYRGGIEEVQFVWPGWKDEGWQIEPVDPPGRVEQTVTDDPANPGVIRVRLLERATQPFALTFRATRPFPAGKPAQPLTLPGIRVDSETTTELVLALADNLEAELRPSGATATRFQVTNYKDDFVLPQNLTELRRTAYTINSDQPTMSLSTTVQKQRVTTSTALELTPSGSTLDVRQNLEFNVAYERLSQVLLMVHESVLDRCRFVSAEGTTLVAIPTGLAEGAWRQHRVALLKPQLGTFQISTLYTVERPAGVTNRPQSTLIVPIVRSSETQFTSVRLRILDGSEPRLKLLGEGWLPQPSRMGSREWTLNGQLGQVELQVESETAGNGWGIRVPRQLFHAYFDPSGSLAGRAWYRVTGNAPTLRLEVPAGITLSEANWNGQRLPANQIQPLTGQPALYELTIPQREDLTRLTESEHLLEVVYVTATQTPLGPASKRTWPVPRLLAGEGLTRSLWLLHLPATHHLWTPPATLAAEYNWQWRGTHWSRIPRHGIQDLQQWLGASSDVLREPLGWRGHVYEFSSYESRDSVNFTTLSRELIVLLGAGLALVGGFVFVNFPVTRHVLTLLSLAFVGTLAAIWYEEPVLVLAQPALIGMTLAILAALGQSLRKRNTTPPVLTVAPTSSLLADSPTVTPESPRHLTPGETAAYVEGPAPPSNAGVAV